ncbi:MAG: DPP IV N-terminal domain-containing protein [Firmicutes bacterium]|jgi:hypothetical protein|nr:DPP IV N-terminal domain-containing protein [Bacillota bacterium]
MTKIGSPASTATLLLVVGLLIAGCSRPLGPPSEPSSSAPIPAPGPGPESRTITIYEPDFESVVLVRKEVAFSEPPGSDPLLFALKKAVPDGVVGVTRNEDGTVTVELEPDWQPSLPEWRVLTIFALADTAAEVEGATGVLLAQSHGPSWQMPMDVVFRPDRVYETPGWVNVFVYDPATGRAPPGLTALPEGFSLIGWLSDGRLLGHFDRVLACYDLETGMVESWGIEVDGAVLSPDGTRLAFTRGNKAWWLSTGAPAEMTEIGIPVTESDLMVGYDSVVVSWSPGSTKLLFGKAYEWEISYYLFDIETCSVMPLTAQHEFEGTFATRGGIWLDEDRILFTTASNKAKDGTSAYSEIGYRRNLALYDVATGEYRLISDVEDGTYLEAHAVVGPEAVVCTPRLDGEPHVEVQLFDVASGDCRQFFPAEHRFVEVAAGAKGIMFEDGPLDLGVCYVWDLCVGTGGGRRVVLRLRTRGGWTAAAWSPDGLKLAFTLVEDENLKPPYGRTFRERTMTYVYRDGAGVPTLPRGAADAREIARFDLPPGYAAGVCGLSHGGAWVEAYRIGSDGPGSRRYFRVEPPAGGDGPAEVAELNRPPGRQESGGAALGRVTVLGIVNGRFILTREPEGDAGNRALVSCITPDGRTEWETEVPGGMTLSLAGDFRTVVGRARQGLGFVSLSEDGRLGATRSVACAHPVRWGGGAAWLDGALSFTEAVWDSGPEGTTVKILAFRPVSGEEAFVEFRDDGDVKAVVQSADGLLLLKSREGRAIPEFRPLEVWEERAGPESGRRDPPHFSPIPLDSASDQVVCSSAGQYILWQVSPVPRVAVPFHVVALRLDDAGGRVLLQREVAMRGWAGLSPRGSYIYWEDGDGGLGFLRVRDLRAFRHLPAPGRRFPPGTATGACSWAPDESFVVVAEPPGASGAQGKHGGGSVVILSLDGAGGSS